MARGTKHVTKTTTALRDAGFSVGIVERRIPNGGFGRTVDLFGFADLMAYNAAVTTLVQVCGEDYSQHVKKMLGAVQGDEKPEEAERRVEYAKRWLANPNRTIELWGWRKLAAYNNDGKRSKRDRWEPRIKVFTLADYQQ